MGNDSSASHLSLSICFALNSKCCTANLDSWSSLLCFPASTSPIALHTSVAPRNLSSAIHSDITSHACFHLSHALPNFPFASISSRSPCTKTRLRSSGIGCNPSLYSTCPLWALAAFGQGTGNSSQQGTDRSVAR